MKTIELGDWTVSVLEAHDNMGVPTNQLIYARNNGTQTVALPLNDPVWVASFRGEKKEFGSFDQAKNWLNDLAA